MCVPSASVELRCVSWTSEYGAPALDVVAIPNAFESPAETDMPCAGFKVVLAGSFAHALADALDCACTEAPADNRNPIASSTSRRVFILTSSQFRLHCRFSIV